MEKRKRLWCLFSMIVLIVVLLEGKNSCAEGLSDRQLYGNGEESIFYEQESKQTSSGKRRNSSTLSSEVTTNAVATTQMADTAEIASTTEMEKKEKEKSSEETTTEETVQEVQEDETETEQKQDEITIEGVTDQEYYKEDVSLRVLAPASKPDLSIQLLECREQQWKVKKEIGLQMTGATMIAEDTVTEEGQYQLAIYDQVNEAKSLLESRTFQIDKTPPVISFQMPKKKEVILSIKEWKEQAVTDQSPVEVTCYVNEQEVTAGSVKTPGEYAIRLQAVDAAGNEASEEQTIVIPEKKKEIRKGGWMFPSCVVVVLFGVSLLVKEWMKQRRKKNV